MEENTLIKYVDKAIVVFSFTFLTAPFTYGASTYISKHPEMFAVIFSFVFIVIGYITQMSYAKIIKLNRTAITSGYENLEPFFSFKKALVSMLFSVLISIITFIISKKYLLSLSPEYKITAIPIFISFFTCALCIVGIILWFFPAKIIIRTRNIIKFVCVFIVASAVPWMFYGITRELMWICAFIFTAIMLIRYIIMRITL